MKLQHEQEHPFTLIENGSQILCPRCGEHLDEWYYCSNCISTCACTLCRTPLSGSCYTCNLCWPNSHIAHRLCFELLEEIQITYRPHCLLHFEEEPEELDCDFCKQKHEGCKYICGECDFQIGVDCASKLMKFHEGQQHLEHFSHRHPLTLLKLDHETCNFCLKSIDCAGYGCAPCKFYIHNSCLEFPQEIRHPFHPRHFLTNIESGDGDWRTPCEACCFGIQGSRYRCNQYCGIQFHPECTNLKPNINYTGHTHFLILVENLSFEGTCEACGFDIEGVFFMRCVECRLNYHVQCDSGGLPPTVWHKEHKHPLIHITETLAKDDSHLLNCNVCGKERDTEAPFYLCAECDFFAHVRCTITDVQSNDGGTMRHLSHRHILILLEIFKTDDISCYGCGKVIQGLAYGCDPCRFYLHNSCAELPIWITDHPLDKHDLALEANFFLRCTVCKKYFNGFRYSCRECNFEIDLDCASLHPSVNLVVHTNEYQYVQDGQERIRHFSHRHHLVILEVAEVYCNLCYKYINDHCYGCAQCDFYIHKSCASLLQEIRHPFHPRHSLKLVYGNPGYCCRSCYFNVQAMRYSCEECGFYLHPECLSLKANIEYKYHHHLLILVENTFVERECDACHQTVQGYFFARCVECDIDFHVQCGSFPTILQEQHEHPLTLSIAKLAKDNSDQLNCAVCIEEINGEHPTYYCADCECYAHIRCVITYVQVDEREKIKHFSHKHFLYLFENKMNDDIICRACERNILASPVYGCSTCKFYLHKSCFDMPKEIQHPFHRHSLTLIDHSSGRHHYCKACHKRFLGFSYCCEDCHFNLDLECCLLLPSLRVEVHAHTLTFFKELHDNKRCCGCNLIPSNKYLSIDVLYARCVKCDFTLHLMCCPLPKTIRHDSHPHPLILGDNFIDLFDGFEDEEYCCDVCEIRRDAQEVVYYCEKCSFVVDLECLFSEVMQFLEGKGKDVESRIVSRKRKGGLTYNKMVKSLTEEEKKLIKSLTYEMEQKIKEGTVLDFFVELKDINVRFSKELSNVDHEQLQLWAMEWMEALLQVNHTEEVDPELEIVNVEGYGNHTEEVDPELEIVNVEGYGIIQEFAPILNKFLEKCKDFCSSNSLTKSLKTIFLTILCGVIEEMGHTEVMSINFSLIIKWWFYLKLVERAGIVVDFAFDHVKSIADIAFFLQDNESSIRKSDFRELHKEIYYLSEEIDIRKQRIEKLKKRADDIVDSYDSEELREKAKRFNKDGPFMLKNAAAGFFDDGDIPKL